MIKYVVGAGVELSQGNMICHDELDVGAGSELSQANMICHDELCCRCRH